MDFSDSNSTRYWAMHSLYCDARKLFSENEPSPDLFPQQEVLNGWPFVVTAYNGIELTLKALLAAERPELTQEEISKKWIRLGHDIHEAFVCISDAAQAHIEVHYTEHRSLFDYDSGDTPTGTASEFMAHISEKAGYKQGGLLRWRYAPLEGVKSVPTTSIWTMYEIWYAACCYLRLAADLGPDCCRVSEMLCHSLVDKIILECPPSGFPDGWDHEELNTWIDGKGGGGLGVLVDLLGCAYRDALSEVELPEPMVRILGANAVAELRRLKHKPDGLDERQLMHRIERSAGYLAVEPDPETGACLFKELVPQ